MEPGLRSKSHGLNITDGLVVALGLGGLSHDVEDLVDLVNLTLLICSDLLALFLRENLDLCSGFGVEKRLSALKHRGADEARPVGVSHRTYEVDELDLVFCHTK